MESEIEKTEFKTSQKLIFTALSKAQANFPVIPKDSEVVVKNSAGKFLYSYKYADLTTIISSVRPSLAKEGLSFTQGMVHNGFMTIIMHESGEVLKSGFIPFEVPKSSDMKTIAGLFTYIKRISLTAALGISADEDVDAAHDNGSVGNSSAKDSPGPQQSQPPPAQTPYKPIRGITPDYVFKSGEHKGKTLGAIGKKRAKEYLDKLKSDGNRPAEMLSELEAAISRLK